MFRKVVSLLCASLVLLISLNVPALSAGGPGETNPFESMDQAREKVLSSMTASNDELQKASSAEQDQKMQQVTEELAARQPQYIVKFKDAVSLQMIYDGIKDYPFTIIGDSSMRMFTIETENIDAVKITFDDKIQFVEEDTLIKTSSITSDQYVDLQWALPALKIPQAWAKTKGSDDVCVAVIDSGWDPNHEDLVSAEIYPGVDYLLGGPVTWDSNGHGTSVTGIIAATTNNGIGIAGACWDVGILPLLVSQPDGKLLISDACKAITDAAATRVVDVINMSFGSGYDDPAQRVAINYALSQGCILIAAAGNDGATSYKYPASLGGVVSVGAIDSSLTVSDFSQKNNAVDVVAPGEGVASTVDPYYSGGYLYAYIDGTSFAAPYVAGIAALVRTLDDSIDSYEFEEILRRTATDRGPAGYDTAYGYGIANAQAILNSIAGTTTKYFISVISNGESYGSATGTGSYAYGTSATVKATPKPGYRFVRWRENGTTVSTKALYTFTVTKARNLVAEFAKIGTPVVTAASTGYNSIKLTWAAVAGAAGYEISRYDAATGLYKAITTVTTTSYTGGSLATGTTYSYKVRVKCVAGSTTTYGGYSAVASVKPVPSTPTGAKATAASYNSVKLTWNATAGAGGYEVWRSTTAGYGYKLAITIATASYINTGLATGTTYYYKIRAYRTVNGVKVYGSYAPVVSAKPVLATPTGVKAARASATSVKVSWNTVAGATGYEVYRATASGGAYSLVKTTAWLNWTNTGLTTGRTYYYKVRAYRTVNGAKVYGAYSALVFAKP